MSDCDGSDCRDVYGHGVDCIHWSVTARLIGPCEQAMAEDGYGSLFRWMPPRPADDMDAHCEQYGVFGVGDRLRRMADETAALEAGTPKSGAVEYGIVVPELGDITTETLDVTGDRAEAEALLARYLDYWPQARLVQRVRAPWTDAATGGAATLRTSPSDASVQWAVAAQYAEVGHEVVYDPRRDRAAAEADLARYRESAESARLVTRTVTYGPWTDVTRGKDTVPPRGESTPAVDFVRVNALFDVLWRLDQACGSDAVDRLLGHNPDLEDELAALPERQRALFASWLTDTPTTREDGAR
ncbi:hypothetical protein [Streptomyces jumonjinensis]|uniref:hypothetical protein n=1 Tax=Streptomyces jumonjinensis TaxID=1945 RepID=UPI0037AA9AEA